MDKKNENLDNQYNIKIISSSESQFLKPWGRGGPIIVKIPVVISHSKINKSIEAEVKLNELANTIQTSNSSIYLTSCKLFNSKFKRSGDIYFSGYIKESIEYTLLKDNSSSSKVRFMTVNLPIDISAKISFYIRPILDQGITPIKLIGTCTKSDEYASNKDNNYFLENMYCDIEEAKILNKNLSFYNNVNSNSNESSCITECFVISISFILLQRQLVNIK